MIDRTEFDLRLDAHTRLTRGIDGQAWKESILVPMPAPRAAVAALLLRLAARLDPTAFLARPVAPALPTPTHA